MPTADDFAALARSSPWLWRTLRFTLRWRHASDWSARTSYDAPMYQNYYWVALLDPVELADGTDRESGQTCAGTTISEVREVEHHGRLAWEALVTPTDQYETRCGCCSL